MLQLWTSETHTPKLSLFLTATGKLQQDACKGQQPSRMSVSPLNHIIIAAVKSEASTVREKIGEQEVDTMLDSGSSVSLLKEEVIKGMRGVVKRKYAQNTRLATAAGEELPILDHVTVHVKLNSVDHVHDFLVVQKLITCHPWYRLPTTARYVARLQNNTCHRPIAHTSRCNASRSC